VVAAVLLLALPLRGSAREARGAISPALLDNERTSRP
jgi:hypothetical protein